MGKKLTTGNIRILFLQCFSLPPGTTCSYLGLRNFVISSGKNMYLHEQIEQDQNSDQITEVHGEW
jgi:hypothetical protein